MKQAWDPKGYATHARFVSDLGQAVLQLLAPQPGERILDLGCGDGALTAKLVQKNCNVLGIDSSSEQLAAAKARGLDVLLMDGESLEFDQEFDAVFSNACLHWLTRADRVVAGVWRSLKDGGRFVAELGGEGNVAQVLKALNTTLARRDIDANAFNPWFFPSVPQYRELLEARGFEVNEIALIPRPTPLPGDIIDWLSIFAQSFLAAVAKPEQDSLLVELRDELKPLIFREDEGVWVVDYVRLRFHASKPTHGT